MNLVPISKVYTFNEKAGLLELGYNDERECAYPIEEALEGTMTRYLDVLHNQVKSTEPTPKSISRQIALTALGGTTEPLKDVDRFDKHLDILVFTLGSMFKMGLNVGQVMKGLDVVATANLKKLTVGKDEQGKQMKPADFVSPEPLLQLILDERK